MLGEPYEVSLPLLMHMQGQLVYFHFPGVNLIVDILYQPASSVGFWPGITHKEVALVGKILLEERTNGSPKESGSSNKSSSEHCWKGECVGFHNECVGCKCCWLGLWKYSFSL